MTAKWQYKEAYEAALVTARELRAENAKLREDIEDQEGYDQMLRDRLRQQTELCVKAEAENARLHKLVQRMWPAFIGDKRATFADRLHVRAEIDELGVEVEQ